MTSPAMILPPRRRRASASLDELGNETRKARAKESAQHVQRWLDQVNGYRGLTALAYQTAWFIARFYNASVGYAWPSQGTLMERVRCSRGGLREAIDQLVDAGLLEVEEQRGRGNTNRYFLRVRAHD